MPRESVDPHILDLFETLTGPHRVRLRACLRPVAVAQPAPSVTRAALSLTPCLSSCASLTPPRHQVPFGDPFWNELLACPTLLEMLGQDAAGATDSDNPVMVHFGERMRE